MKLCAGSIIPSVSITHKILISMFNMIVGFADPEFMNIMKTRRVTTDEKDQGCEGEPV